MGSRGALFFLLLLFPTVFSDLAANTAALLRLQAAVRGRTLRWNTSSPNPCSWEGIKCDSANSSVIELRLPGDGLSGQIPLNTIGNLTELRALSLRRNSLSGPLPSDLDSCTELLKLHLDGNKFSGEIPVNFNKLTKLRVLRLEENQFNGTLPDLESLSHLRDFNVSFNRLTGPVPASYQRLPNESSYAGNSLCGGPLDSCPNDNGDGDKLSAGAIAGIAIGTVIGALLVVLVLWMLWRNRRGRRISAQVPMSPEQPSPAKLYPVLATDNRELDNGFSGRGVVKKEENEGIVFFEENNENDFSLEELLKASAEVLGKGSGGTTYRAYLDGGGEVIVKRLKNVGLSEKEFREKIEVLGSYRHENLVHLLGYFYGIHERLVVYDPMPISLSEALHGSKGGYRKALTWAARGKIALTAARGIEYLHSRGPKVAHGNLHASNILLTNSNVARLSDFGLLQLAASTPPSSKTNGGGYCAPEIAGERKPSASQKADVYSFGVVLLQLVTGKEASEEGIELPQWVQSVGEERWMIEVFDPQIMVQGQNSGDQMILLLQLAISCTAHHPNTRPSMLQVTQRIQHILNT
ncbi:PREDICTED: probable inactive receptor kinase RLK902 [Ipomoea nil]|uniref:probable inactive receptor kinase RLK902 n=1 Tax=Ipomoea nil TaxID=35883 RepID=UPI000901A97B|nr:PREDICTED: probable inactive receptor kinase RLK902 [Ipomoea nil]